MSLSVHNPWVDSAKLFDDRHYNYSNLDDINNVVAPIIWATCFWILVFLDKKLSNKTTAKW